MDLLVEGMLDAGPTQPASSSRTVFTHLHDIYISLRSSFPNPTTPYLHHNLSRDSGPSDASSSTRPPTKDDLISRLREVRAGIDAFKQTWDGERARLAVPGAGGTPGQAMSEDPNVAAERRRAVLLRVMMDWCNQQSAYAPVHANLRHVLSTISPTPPPLFVRKYTTTDPTKRLVATGQALFQDAPEVNDGDPDYGMRTDEVQTDSITFGGKRLVLEIQIRHPQMDLLKHGEDAGYQLAEIKFSYGTSAHGEDVFLPSIDEVLGRLLRAYLNIVNRILIIGHEGLDEEAGTRPTLALQAEQAMQAFEDELRALLALDNRMGVIGEVEEGTTEVDWFDQVEKVKVMLDEECRRSEPRIYLPRNLSVLPSFHLFEPTDALFPPNPLITLRPDDGPDATTSMTSDGSLETARGWKISLPDPTVVSRRCMTSDESATSVTFPRPRAGIRIEDLLLRHLETKPGDAPPADSAWERVQEGQVQRYACATSGQVGSVVDLWRLSDGSVWDVLGKLREQLVLNTLFQSCFTDGTRVTARTDDVDGDVDLDAFLADDSTLATNVTVLLQGHNLVLSCPRMDATSSGYEVLTSSVAVTTVKGKPTVQVQHALRSSSGSASEVADLNAYHGGQALLDADGNVPRWLAALIAMEPSKLPSMDSSQSLKRRRSGSDVRMADEGNDESAKRRRLGGE